MKKRLKELVDFDIEVPVSAEDESQKNSKK